MPIHTRLTCASVFLVAHLQLKANPEVEAVVDEQLSKPVPEHCAWAQRPVLLCSASTLTAAG